MATVEHFGPYHYDLGSGGLGPQQSTWISFGPDDRFKDATVIITPHPSPDVAGTSSSVAMNVLSVGDIFVTTVPTIVGDLVLTEAHAGASITNGGQQPVRYFSAYLSVIRP
jgi:hypothetical protein